MSVIFETSMEYCQITNNLFTNSKNKSFTALKEGIQQIDEGLFLSEKTEPGFIEGCLSPRSGSVSFWNKNENGKLVRGNPGFGSNEIAVQYRALGNMSNSLSSSTPFSYSQYFSSDSELSASNISRSRLSSGSYQGSRSRLSSGSYQGIY